MTGNDTSASSVLTDSEAERPAEGFDLGALSAGFYDNPYPTYRALRRFAPIKKLPDGGYFLTRYADCLAVYKDPARFSSDKRHEFRPKFGNSSLYLHHTTSLVFNDPPLHGRVRRLIAGALAPRAIAAMDAGLAELVERLLDAMAARNDVDPIEDFAAAIPVEVIGNLLGVPHDERGPLRGWSLAILGALEPRLTEAQFARGAAAVEAFADYLKGLVADRRRRPGDPEKDVLTRLIAGESSSERLSEQELLQNCIFLLNAGHETTTNLIGNGLVLLADHPLERRRLIEQPTLVKPAIEEILRFESSNQLGNRITKVPVTLDGVAMPEKTSIHLCIGAANRDPTVFEDPERFDIARDPNRHLAFGSGIHQCVGMSLARLEGQIAIGAFLRRFPAYRLGAEPTRGGRARFRGFLSVPARLN